MRFFREKVKKKTQHTRVSEMGGTTGLTLRRMGMHVVSRVESTGGGGDCRDPFK